MKVAAIDIGSNSIHMVVVRIASDATFEVVDREKDMVRLGKAGFESGALTQEAMDAGIEALSRMKRLSVAHGCEYLVAAATSAVREAENRELFLGRVLDEVGIKVRVLSGLEEADLIFRAVRDGIDLADRKVLILDLGGGSTEVVVGNASGTQLCESLPIGVVRFTDRYAQNPGVTSVKRYRALCKEVRSLALPVIQRVQGIGFETLIGTSGTFRALGELLRTPEKETGGPASQIPSFTPAELESLVERLQGMTGKERASLSGMNPKRADNIAVGATIVQELLRLISPARVHLSNRALRDGLVLECARAIPRLREALEGASDLRRRSVQALARAHPPSVPHGNHVARLALQLFDQTGGNHGLGPHDRELLEHAARLHDIGLVIGYTRHHRHSQYVISNAELLGFNPDEVGEIAQVARYHRKSTPASSHLEFRRLSPSRRTAVSAMAGILRLADALDRSHRSNVRGLQVEHGEGEMVVRVDADEDCELEMAAARRKSDLLQELWGTRLQFLRGQAETSRPPLVEVNRLGPA